MQTGLSLAAILSVCWSNFENNFQCYQFIPLLLVCDQLVALLYNNGLQLVTITKYGIILQTILVALKLLSLIFACHWALLSVRSTTNNISLHIIE